MASTQKTPNLGLNQWEEEDRPKRSDFVADNLIIDSFLGNHIKDSSLHLSADEKDRATTPFDACTIYGTGSEQQYIKFNYTPRIAMVFMKNAPFMKNSGDYDTINAGVAILSGNTGGIRIQQYGVTLNQSTSAENGSFYNLNSRGKEYILITFK